MARGRVHGSALSIAFAFAVVAVAVLIAGCSGSGKAPAASGASTTAAPSSSRSTAAASASPRTSSAAALTSAPPSSTDPYGSKLLIARTRWTSTAKGRQLQVFPTAAGRTDEFPSAANRAWAEVLSDAPNANTPGMLDQFLCHWNFARGVDPTKPSWNLEPWRPVVGYAATVAALCNPGGPED